MSGLRDELVESIRKAGLCASVETLDGKLRLPAWGKKKTQTHKSTSRSGTM